jgi:hypothetical protein
MFHHLSLPIVLLLIVKRQGIERPILLLSFVAPLRLAIDWGKLLLLLLFWMVAPLR